MAMAEGNWGIEAHELADVFRFLALHHERHAQALRRYDTARSQKN